MLRQRLDSCFRLPFLMKPDPRVAGPKRAYLKAADLLADDYFRPHYGKKDV
ncbi:MAG: hypothetical protein ACETWK_03030 [Candidatus Aminicenantaceae bacterium]